MADAPNRNELTPPSSQATVELTAAAGRTVRIWAALADPDAVLDRVDALGREEVVASSELVARTSALHPGTGAERELDRLRDLVDRIHSPVPRRMFGIQAPMPPIEERLEREERALGEALATLACERDEIARFVVAARSLAVRLRGADDDLERAIHAIDFVERSCKAAARELVSTAPRIAATFRDDALRRLAERRAEALTQLAVLRQARLALAMLSDGREALGRAIDRARQTMVAALRTAVLAARVASQGGRARAMATALEASAARRSVEDAIDEMRRAIAI